MTRTAIKDVNSCEFGISKDGFSFKLAKGSKITTMRVDSDQSAHTLLPGNNLSECSEH